VTDPVRPPLDVARLRASLPAPFTALDVVDETTSTNADLLGAAAGRVLAAEFQRSGRGRLDRSWTSPPRAGLLFSVVLAPPVAQARWGWLPLLAGVAVCDAVAGVAGVAAGPVSLKWPNDVLLGELKLAGILVQATATAANPDNPATTATTATAVIGVGLNVSTMPAELPVATATSLTVAGATGVDRTALLSAILAELAANYLRWTDAAGDAVASGLAEAYRARCATIGRPVTVTTSSGDRAATALGVDDDGRLRVRFGDVESAESEQALAAGDIVHLRVSG
jgi:BirA family transcriptional regulator, biotin operon repressor / biotin---[acetyl-CoA-carboxylase] ligase